MIELETSQTDRDSHHATATIRRPVLTDARMMHRLVRESRTLDINSCYLYLLLCRDFSMTCRVAEHDGDMVGFVTGYIPPERPRMLFIWQIAVAPSHRKRGIALRMVLDILASLPDADSFTIGATITPSNAASEKLFVSLARRLGRELGIDDGFAGPLFAMESHEPERMFCIGPVIAGPSCGS